MENRNWKLEARKPPGGVFPAQAGIHAPWTPAFAGVTVFAAVVPAIVIPA